MSRRQPDTASSTGGSDSVATNILQLSVQHFFLQHTRTRDGECIHRNRNIRPGITFPANLPRSLSKCCVPPSATPCCSIACAGLILPLLARLSSLLLLAISRSPFAAISSEDIQLSVSLWRNTRSTRKCIPGRVALRVENKTKATAFCQFCFFRAGGRFFHPDRE